MKPKVKMIASGNGMAAIREAFPMLLSGSSALDACVAAATIVENDPEELTVGFGGLPNSEGIVELDAAVMDGCSGRAGCVAALQNIRNPTQVARLVLKQTDRVLLVGKGAIDFARMNGFELENLLTETSRRLWSLWKRSRDNVGNYSQQMPEIWEKELLEKYPNLFSNLPKGTVHIAALDSRGNLACATSTSGHAFKLPGRVGDSAIVGAGLYAENGAGSCGSVGCGELNLQNLTSYAIVRSLREGGRLDQCAIREAIHAIQRYRVRTPTGERNDDNLDVRYFILTPSGYHLGISTQTNHHIAVAEEDGTRLEKCKVIDLRPSLSLN